MKKNLLAGIALMMALVCSWQVTHAEEKEDTTKDEVTLRLLNYDTTGSVTIGDGLAQFDIPKGFKYLNPAQSEYVLHDLWGNPPSTTLGMIFPAEASEFLPNTWAIEISYEEDGHVKDDDAKDIKYDELLEELQKSADEANTEREKQGYQTVKLVGWASTPYYDSQDKKLHWAKELVFEGDSASTLNYNIRVLGRKGVLVLNAIGGMDQLAEIKTNIRPLLATINFKEGNRYADFNESSDKTAAYGVAGLIAGGVLVKTGLLSKIGIVLIKFIKPIMIGLAAVGGGIWKFFSGRKDDQA